MPILQDIGDILGQIANTEVGRSIKSDFNNAKEASLSTRSAQPMIDFYRKYESQLRGGSLNLNDFLLSANETPIIPVESTDKNINKPNLPPAKNTNVVKELALPILGLIAGGVAVLILLKTLKK
mgnify:CR=1 FL=1